MRILFTNITLATRTGTEMYVRDAAIGLLARGHEVMVYAPDSGPVAEEMRRATVPVVRDLEALRDTPPDIIHGHHLQQTMAALAYFPRSPAIFVGHDWTAWHDQPPRFPRLYRYVAVDSPNRDRLVIEHGIPETRVVTLPNWVDLERFRQRPPLPERPARALVFSNYARADSHLPAVREACRAAGIDVEAIGSGVGRSIERPEDVLALGDFDLVFAKGKCALEALAAGAAVVLSAAEGTGEMVTRARVDALRVANFGRRTCRRPLDAKLLAVEIGRYDAADAAEVTARIREVAGLDTALDQLTRLYEEVMTEHRETPVDADEERLAWGRHLHANSSWYPALRARMEELGTQCRHLESEIRRLVAERDEAKNRIATLEEEACAHSGEGKRV